MGRKGWIDGWMDGWGCRERGRKRGRDGWGCRERGLEGKDVFLCGRVSKSVRCTAYCTQLGTLKVV